jgi:hypothetical protein
MENRVIVDGVEIINDMTFKEFKESSMHDETLQIQFLPLFDNKKTFIEGTSKIIFNTFSFFTYTVPLILIPVAAYHYDNWYLLFGILFSSVSIHLGSQKKQWQWIFPSLLLATYWYHYGFHLREYLTFFWLCLFWGGTFGYFTSGIEDEYSKINILKDEELFNKLSAEKIIYVMRKEK